MINNALQKLARTNPIHREIYDSLNKDKQFFEQLRRKATEALDALPSANGKPAAKREQGKTERAEAIKMSRMVTSNLNDIVDDVKQMNGWEAEQFLKGGNYVRIMTETPQVILDSMKNAGNHPVIMRADAFYLATRRAGIQQGHYHGLGDIMKKLPSLLNNPEAIVTMDNGRLNILVELPSNQKKNGIISVEMNTIKNINNEHSPYNIVITVFENKGNYIRNLMQKHAVHVEYEKEDLAQVSSQLHEWLTAVNAKPSSTHSIPRGQAESQENLSLKPASNISEENRRLIEENETYKAVIGKLNRQIAAMQKKVVDPKGVRKPARDVRAEYQSKIPQADPEQKLTDLFDHETHVFVRSFFCRFL